MTEQQQTDRNKQAGRDGTHVDTTGMSSQQKERTDREVNEGRKEAKR